MIEAAAAANGLPLDFFTLLEGADVNPIIK